MQKNVSGQKLCVFCFDATTNLPKTGDAANLTAYVSKDFGAVTVLADTSATEMDATNAKGLYLFDLAQAETNADTLIFSGKSSTANIVLLAQPATVYTTPANFATESIDSSGRTLLQPAQPEVTFTSLAVTGNFSIGAGLTITQSTTNASAVVITGNTSGYGIAITGGSTGGGMSVVGGGTSGNGIEVTGGGGTTSHGIVFTGGTGTVGSVNDGLKAVAGSGGVPIRGNITGNITGSVANLTNAPTAGDFTAAMKTSLNAATPASTGAIGTGGITSASFASGATMPRVTLVDTTTNLTNNTPTIGDVTLAATQPSYAPAKAGDAMSLTTPTGNALVAATAAQVTTDHGSGSYIRNTEPLDASSTRSALGLASANIDTQLSNIQTPITWTKNFLGGDQSIDITTTPWNDVVKIAGTATELTRKKLRDVNGNNITNVTTVIGSAKDS